MKNEVDEEAAAARGIAAAHLATAFMLEPYGALPEEDDRRFGRELRWRGQWSAEALIHNTQVQPGRSAAGLCMVLQGNFLHGEAILKTGQGLLWWDRSHDKAPNTIPLLPGDEHSRLILVSLKQTTR